MLPEELCRFQATLGYLPESRKLWAARGVFSFVSQGSAMRRDLRDRLWVWLPTYCYE